MLRADKVIPAGDWSGEPADSVVLDFDERYRRRVVMTGVGGLAFLLDLPEPTMLRGGDGLRLEDGRIVEVVAAPEPLAEIRAPRSPRACPHRLASRQPPSADRTYGQGAAHPPRSGDRGDGRGPGRQVIAHQAPFNPEGGAYVGGRGRRTETTMVMPPRPRPSRS